jgi:hypothetical protein
VQQELGAGGAVARQVHDVGRVLEQERVERLELEQHRLLQDLLLEARVPLAVVEVRELVLLLLAQDQQVLEQQQALKTQIQAKVKSQLLMQR